MFEFYIISILILTIFDNLKVYFKLSKLKFVIWSHFADLHYLIKNILLINSAY